MIRASVARFYISRQLSTFIVVDEAGKLITAVGNSKQYREDEPSRSRPSPQVLSLSSPPRDWFGKRQ